MSMQSSDMSLISNRVYDAYYGTENLHCGRLVSFQVEVLQLTLAYTVTVSVISVPGAVKLSVLVT